MTLADAPCDTSHGFFGIPGAKHVRFALFDIVFFLSFCDNILDNPSMTG